MSFIEKVNTKLQAYKLVHDPTELLSLLYSKYGDIEEDFNYLYINQLLYNRSSHYNTIFKEYQYIDYIDEFLKRYYKLEESNNRIPKLNDYYKNYHRFFCRPIFCSWKISKIMHRYGDNRAEIFYKNNYATTNEDDEEKDNSSQPSLSTLDNLTNNKTIFDKKIKYFIDNEIKGTLTLDSSRTLKSNINLLTKRSKDDSFVKYISPFVNYQKAFIKDNKSKQQNKTTSNLNMKYKNYKINKTKKTIKKISSKIKNSLYNCDTLKNNQKKIFLSPKLKPYLSNYISNLEEFKKNKPKMIGKEKIKNKTCHNNSNNINSNFRLFSKLSITLNNNNLNNHPNFNNILRNSNIIEPNIKKNRSNSNSNSKSKNKNNNGNNTNNPSSDNTIQKLKHKTFENKNVNSMNNLAKFHSNSNFSFFMNQQNTLKNKKKSNYGSNFNLVKSPISSIHSNNIQNIKKIYQFSKNKTYFQNPKNSIINNYPSFSIPKNSIISKNTKENYNKENKKFHKRKNNASYNNTINLNNVLFSSQRSTSNTSNTNILSPKNTINSHKIINNIYKASRNKKQIVTHTQTNIKSFRKESLIQKTKSIDDQKIKLKNILFGINKNSHKMNQKLASQIEELIKKSKIPIINHHNSTTNNMNFYNGNEKGSKKTIIENSNSSIHNTHSGNNISSRIKSLKQININSRIYSEDRKERIIKMIFSKK